MARRNKGINIDGILVLDKPQGMTSNKALQIVKRLFDAAKAGHTGSLDPMATGVLPLCFGEATKVSQYLLDSDKTYIATVQLGVSTTTGDAEGEVTATTEVPELPEARLRETLASFTGEIEQQAPVYSALKQDGVPLYKLARAGKEIRQKTRKVTIHSIEPLSFDGDSFSLQVSCGKGTYIRTLAEDIGKALGCCAHLSALRRIKAGPFTLADAHTLEALQKREETGELTEALLRSADSAIDWMPGVELDQAQGVLLRQGQQVPVRGPAGQALVRVYAGEQFIGIGSINESGILKAVRLMQTGR